MWRRRRNEATSRQTSAAVLEPPEVDEEFDGSLDELLAEIAAIAARERSHRDLVVERRRLRLRHLAGIRLIDGAPEAPSFVEPSEALLPAGDPLPEFDGPGSLTAGLLRAAILRDGCVLVRGLIGRERALEFAGEIDRAFTARAAGDANNDGYYEEFHPHRRFGAVVGRGWIEQGGGVLAGDAPKPHAELMELFEAAGLPALVSDYLGEPALISLHKTTLRKADPSVSGAWHQDGFFMGPVRSLNLWLSLSRCGDESPGLDILPRRLETYAATNTDEAPLDYIISQRVAEQVAGDTPIIRPIFEPGDALLFDELFLHRTGSDPSMPKPRFAVESWFFGGSAFPTEYAPIAIPAPAP